MVRWTSPWAGRSSFFGFFPLPFKQMQREICVTRLLVCFIDGWVSRDFVYLLLQLVYLRIYFFSFSSSDKFCFFLDNSSICSSFIHGVYSQKWCEDLVIRKERTRRQGGGSEIYNSTWTYPALVRRHPEVSIFLARFRHDFGVCRIC